MSYETGRQAFRDGKTLAKTTDKVATEETLGWLDELADTVRRIEATMDQAPFFCWACGADAVAEVMGVSTVRWRLSCDCTEKLGRETISARHRA